METSLDRVTFRLQAEASILPDRSKGRMRLEDVLQDLRVRMPRLSTLQLLEVKSRRWFADSLNVASEVLAAQAEGLEPTNHTFLFQQIAEDFETVITWLKDKPRQLPRKSVTEALLHHSPAGEYSFV